MEGFIKWLFSAEPTVEGALIVFFVALLVSIVLVIIIERVFISGDKK